MRFTWRFQISSFILNKMRRVWKSDVPFWSPPILLRVKRGFCSFWAASQKSWIFAFDNGKVCLFVLSGVTSQKCRRAPHSKLCQSPSAFQTQGWFECQESHVRNLTSISVCILSRNFPSGISYRSTIELIDPWWGYATRGCELLLAVS